MSEQRQTIDGHKLPTKDDIKEMMRQLEARQRNERFLSGLFWSLYTTVIILLFS